MIKLFTWFGVLFIATGCSYAQASKTDRGYALVDRSFEIVYQFPDSALHFAYEALQIAQQSKDTYLEGTAYGEIGSAFMIKGDPQRSLTYLFKAISVLPDTEQGQSKKASVYSSLGNSYYKLGDYTQAVFYYRKSFLLKQKIGHEFESAIAASQLVGVYGVTGNTDSAFYFAGIAKPILDENQAHVYRANLYNSIGAAYEMAGEPDSALANYIRSAEITAGLDLQIQLQPSYYNIGNLLVKQKKYDDALDYFHRGMAIFETHPNPGMMALYYESLSAVYQAIGDIGLALDAKSKQDSLQLLIQKNKEDLAIKAMEEKFKLAESEKILSQQKYELQQKDLDLAEENALFYQFAIITVIVLSLLGTFAVWLWFRKKAQEKIEKEKEKFFSNVMHEIRTPLSLITGPVENLKNGLSDDDREKNFDLIHRNSKRLTTLVNQLLDVSKIDSGKFGITARSGNFSLFLAEVVSDFGILAESKQIELHLDEENTGHIIRTDFDALEKILSNLVSNAIKYSPSKTKIKITAKISEKEILMGVRDQGSGISKADRQEIFNRFSRGKNSAMSPGIGIGLSLVKHLVNLLGGTIQLESTLNEGSYFEIKLPVELPGIETDLRTIPEDAGVILLVEDDPDMREFIRATLQRVNYHVVCAGHGAQALMVLNDLMPDLILSDVMMPEMDGITLAGEIKKNPLFQHIPLILLSAKKSSETKLAGLGHGADLYIEKPFSPNELLLTVQNHLATLSKAREKFDAQIVKKELSFEEKIRSEDHYIQKLNAEILKEIDNADFSVEELADRLAISRSQLHRKVKSLTGKSISVYVRIIRLEKAYDLLKKNAGNVTEVAYSSGFNSQSYFTKSFTAHFGYPPSDIALKKN